MFTFDIEAGGILLTDAQLETLKHAVVATPADPSPHGAAGPRENGTPDWHPVGDVTNVFGFGSSCATTCSFGSEINWKAGLTDDGIFGPGDARVGPHGHPERSSPPGDAPTEAEALIKLAGRLLRGRVQPRA